MSTQQQLFSCHVLKRQRVVFSCRWVDQRGVTRLEAADWQEEKLLSGLLFSVKTFCQKIVAPKHSRGAPELLPVTGFNSFSTSFYKLHYFETATGYKFVIMSGPNVADLKDFMKNLYITVFVPIVLRSSGTPDPARTAMLFGPALQDYFEKKMPQLVNTGPQNQPLMLQCKEAVAT